jgi:hypothetical protein
MTRQYKEARLRWLLAFAHRALTTPDDVARAEREIGEFVSQVLPLTAPVTPIEKLFHAMRRRPGEPDPSELVRDLQRQVRSGLDALREHGFYQAAGDAPSIREVVRLPTGVMIPLFGGSRTSRFHAAVMLLLYDVGSRLRSCPGCSAWFVKVRKRSYCTARCASRFQHRMWKANNRERALELQHAAYERWVRRQPGKSDARVERRPRGRARRS